MNSARSLVAVALVAALTGCGGDSPLAVVSSGMADPKPSSVAATREVADRAIAAADASARRWGGSARDLDGYTIELGSEVLDHCGSHLVGAYVGCTQSSARSVYVDVKSWSVSLPIACVEMTVLAHEVGHVVIGDHDHRDARWCSAAFWRDMAAAVAASVPLHDEACLAQLAAEAREPGVFFTIQAGAAGCAR